MAALKKRELTAGKMISPRADGRMVRRRLGALKNERGTETGYKERLTFFSEFTGTILPAFLNHVSQITYTLVARRVNGKTRKTQTWDAANDVPGRFGAFIAESIDASFERTAGV
jgi:hypothetical protein